MAEGTELVTNFIYVNLNCLILWVFCSMVSFGAQNHLNVMDWNSEHQATMMRLQCCAGLAEMANRQYKSAAKKLTTANLDHCGELTDIMSTQVSEWIFRYFIISCWSGVVVRPLLILLICGFSQWYSPFLKNIATYGGLCALATLDRVELYKQVITSSSFKLFLELDPQLRYGHWLNFFNFLFTSAFGFVFPIINATCNPWRNPSAGDHTWPISN